MLKSSILKEKIIIRQSLDRSENNNSNLLKITYENFDAEGNRYQITALLVK